MTSGSLRNYYRDEMIDDMNENNEAGNYRINNNKTTTSKSFAWKIRILRSTPADDKTWDTEFVVSLKNSE